MGFRGHTLTKRRQPAVTIGLKRNTNPLVESYGVQCNLRDQTRFGKAHHPNYNFGYRKPTVSEGVPAPNSYNPKIDLVRTNAPQIAFHGRKNRMEIVEDAHPSPNSYTLKPVIQPAKRSTQKTFAPRFPKQAEHGPAPNSYILPTPDAYKYKRTTNTLAVPRRKPAITNDITPPPNAYSLRQATGLAKTFGKKPTNKRTTYITREDNAY